MIANSSVAGSMLNEHKTGLVQFDARFDLFSKKERLAELCDNLLSDYEGQELLAQLQTSRFDDLFFSVAVNPDDLRIAAMFSRACVIYFYDNSSPKYPQHNSVLSLRHDRSFFDKWLEMVRVEQYHLFLDILATMQLDLLSANRHEAFESAFELHVTSLLTQTSDYQKELFHLSSLVHNTLSENKALYACSLADIKGLYLHASELKTAFDLHRWWKGLCNYSVLFVRLDSKDLSGLVIVNTQLGVEDYFDYVRNVRDWAVWLERIPATLGDSVHTKH